MSLEAVTSNPIVTEDIGVSLDTIIALNYTFVAC